MTSRREASTPSQRPVLPPLPAVLGAILSVQGGAALAKGLAEFTVVFGHVLRNALLPLTTVVGFALIGIIEGAFFVELLYGIPGIGQLSLQAVGARDYDVLMAITILGATTFIVINALVDVAYTFIDPRVRLQSDSR